MKRLCLLNLTVFIFLYRISLISYLTTRLKHPWRFFLLTLIDKRFRCIILLQCGENRCCLFKSCCVTSIENLFPLFYHYYYFLSSLYQSVHNEIPENAKVLKQSTLIPSTVADLRERPPFKILLQVMKFWRRYVDCLQ